MALAIIGCIFLPVRAEAPAAAVVESSPGQDGDHKPSAPAKDAADSVILTLAIESGDHQKGRSGDYLPQPLVVRARDVAGRVVPNVVVTFQVTSKRGLISNTMPGEGFTLREVMTDGDGRAGVFLHQPFRADFTTSVTASAGSRQVTFTSATFVHKEMTGRPVCGTIRPGPNPGEITLNWTYHGDNAEWFLIQVSTDNVHWRDAAKIVDPDATSTTISNLDQRTPYYFSICAGRDD